jgi:hypothetical protein
MLLKRGSFSRGGYRSSFEMNSRQCSCCLTIPHRLRPVVTGQQISYLCDNCYARYNSGHTVVPLKEGAL